MSFRQPCYYKSKQRIFRPEEEEEECDDHPVEVPVLTFPAPKKNVLSQVISTKCYTVYIYYLSHFAV